MPDEQLSERELDAAIAVRLFGFDWWRSRVTRGKALFPEGQQPEWFKYRATGDESLCTDWDCAVPRYSESIEAAMEVEDRIAEIGMKREYIIALWAITGVDHAKFSSETDWLIVHATAEQRCLAALKTVEQKQDSK